MGSRPNARSAAPRGSNRKDEHNDADAQAVDKASRVRAGVTVDPRRTERPNTEDHIEPAQCCRVDGAAHPNKRE